MKLLFWPMLLYAVVHSFFFGDRKDFWCIKLRGTLLGLVLIPVLFYTYTGVIGKSPDFINIAIFFIAAAIAYFYEYRLLKKEPSPCDGRKALVILLTLAALFVLFTFKVPTLAIFKDPTSGSYGI